MFFFSPLLLGGQVGQPLTDLDQFGAQLLKAAKGLDLLAIDGRALRVTDSLRAGLVVFLERVERVGPSPDRRAIALGRFDELFTQRALAHRLQCGDLADNVSSSAGKFSDRIHNSPLLE